MESILSEGLEKEMVSLLIAALRVVLGFSTGSVWAHVTTDTPSFTE